MVSVTTINAMNYMDTFKCGDCQKEFQSYENFLIHKLLVEQYKLTIETSVKIPGLRLPNFVKITSDSATNSERDKSSIASPHATTSKSNEVNVIKKSDDFTAIKNELTETFISPVVEVVVDSTNSEDVLSDGMSDESQPELLKIDEGGSTKETSSPPTTYSSDTESKQKKEYYCKDCKRFYKNKVVLRVHHETVHSSSRPYRCQACRQGFKTKGTLVRHSRSHTGERPFSCSECKRGFLDSGTLARHVHRIHRKRPFKLASDMKVVITRLQSQSQNDQTEKASI